MIILGIETSCDETACGIVEDGKKLLANTVVSSMDLHAVYGGVVPEIAARSHIESIIPVIGLALEQAGCKWQDIDGIAVTYGAGLGGCLLVGVMTARTLAITKNKPLYAINHVEAHAYANFLTEIGSNMQQAASDKQKTAATHAAYRLPHSAPSFPMLGLIVSGGHSQLALWRDHFDYTLLGQTQDDAIGEAFDKVAKMLLLPYPGGPHIEQLAKKGNPKAYPFTAGHVKKNPLFFSFSGLKTSVLYQVRNQPFNPEDIAASFQETAFLDVIKKAKHASASFHPKAIFLGGGVCNNLRLRQLFQKEFDPLPICWPPLNLSLDNAAMIAGLGGRKFKGNSDPLDLDAHTRIPLA